jgi:hypothetical protein
MKAVFSARQAEGFAWNAGAHKRWARIFRYSEWWWELGGDWGQGVVQGFVLGEPCRILARVDLSSPTAGAAAWIWAADVLSRRGGIDGLGSEWDEQLAVSLERNGLTISGRCVRDGAQKIALKPGRATSGPCSLVWECRNGTTTVTLDRTERITCHVHQCLPGPLILSARTNGALESNLRFGDIIVEAEGL